MRKNELEDLGRNGKNYSKKEFLKSTLIKKLEQILIDTKKKHPKSNKIGNFVS